MALAGAKEPATPMIYHRRGDSPGATSPGELGSRTCTRPCNLTGTLTRLQFPNISTRCHPSDPDSVCCEGYLRNEGGGGGGPAEESLGVVGGSPLLHAMLQ